MSTETTKPACAVCPPCDDTAKMIQNTRAGARSPQFFQYNTIRQNVVASSTVYSRIPTP